MNIWFFLGSALLGGLVLGGGLLFMDEKKVDQAVQVCHHAGYNAIRVDRSVICLHADGRIVLK